MVWVEWQGSLAFWGTVQKSLLGFTPPKDWQSSDKYTETARNKEEKQGMSVSTML